MRIFNLFIERPVLSVVISIIICLLGIISFFSLPVTQYPEIEPPSVTVTAKYTGASAGVCAKAVVTPLERSINGVPGMKYMTSVSGNDGTSVINVYFKNGTDPDLAAVSVQNRVTAVLDELPEEVIQAGVITEKEVNSMLLYLNLLSNDSTLDEKFIYNFADINILSELKRIEGVGFADIMGSREYAMRIWLIPDRMVAYNVSAHEVIEALRNENIEAAPGKIGESSGKYSQSLQYVLRYTGKLTGKSEYENIIVKTGTNGQLLRIKDIAELEFGSLDYDILSKENGRPSAAIMIKQRPGSNASEVIAAIKKRMAYLKAKKFPPGMEYTISYDVSRFLDASISEVIKTLIEAFILVGLVVFIFLKDIRSTLIPVLAVPISLIGTLFFMQILGFSINLLTLFALVLSIGIVVDNAIVVVEAFHVKLQNNPDPLIATREAMKEMGGAIISITLIMSAVFLPVAFLNGPVGVFYRQFSVTMAISIIISGLIAITITPALCSRLRITVDHAPKNNFLSRYFVRFYHMLETSYASILKKIFHRKSYVFVLLTLLIILSGILFSVIPTAFIPNEDQGVIYANITTPSGSTLERTEIVANKVEVLAKALKEVQSVSTLAGYSLFSEGTGASFGMCMISLKPWQKRKKNVEALIEDLREKTENIHDARIEFFSPPAVPGYGNSEGFEISVQDQTGTAELRDLEIVTKKFVSALNESPEIENTFTTYDASFPQYLISIDHDKAAQKGVTVSAAMYNLQALIGSYYATNFIRFGQLYKVMLQSLPRYRAQPQDIQKLYVKNVHGEMVPYSAFMEIKRVFGPEQLTRYNMHNSAIVSGQPAAGFSSGEAIKAIRRIAKQQLPRGYEFEWSGMVRDEVNSGNQTLIVFLLSLLFVYLLLAVQYENFLMPLSVILSLPAGLFGAWLMLYLAGLQNNIYAQVAVVMLIGLLGKNAILVVEFALKRLREGVPAIEAAIQGGLSRMRPILMTSLAFIAGLIPLVFSTGAGAVGNRTIGTAAAGGMFFGTIFGLIIVPGLFVFFSKTMNQK